MIVPLEAHEPGHRPNSHTSLALEDRLNATSSSLLSERLEELTDEGILERRSFDEIPPRGRELEVRIQPVLEWAATED